jgi:very-short-patch-repair endonuclease
VYRLRDHPPTWESRLWAALLDAGPGAVVGLRSAARLHGLWRHRNRDELEVVRPRGGNHRVELGRLVETRELPADQVTTVAGFPVTTLARTAFDLVGDPDADIAGRPWCAEAHHRRSFQMLNDALARRGLRMIHEVNVLAAIGKRGRSGTALIRRFVKEFGPRYTPTHSDAESLFVLLLARYDMPQPRRQVTFDDDDGVIGTVDFYVDDAETVVEVDSTWHDGPLDEVADELRDKRLRALGVEVERVRYGALALEPAKTMRALRQLLHSRSGGG